jgi:hypothetical protein
LKVDARFKNNEVIVAPKLRVGNALPSTPCFECGKRNLLGKNPFLK